MQVQLLVGLLCCRQTPDAVEITIGDMVNDPIAGKKRDVDVTVVAGKEGFAAKAGYEVKHESEPLDLPSVESLICKLQDMPSLRTKSVVSCSGFTKSALRKLEYHGLGAYLLQPYDGPIKGILPLHTLVGSAQDSLLQANLVTLLEPRLIRFHIEGFDQATAIARPMDPEAPIYNQDGTIHYRFRALQDVVDDIHLSIAQAHISSPANVVDPNSFPNPLPSEPTQISATPLRTTVDLKMPVYISYQSEMRRLTKAQVEGTIVQRIHRDPLQFWVMRALPSGEVFGAAAITGLPSMPDAMLAMLFSPADTLLEHRVLHLSAQQRNAIRNLRLKQ